MTEEPSEFDYRHLPVDTTPGRSFAWSGMVLFLLIEGTVLASLVTSYVYFRVMAVAGWPPPGVPLPSLQSPAVAVALLVASAVLVSLAHRAKRSGRHARFRLAGWAACGVLAAYVAWSLGELRTLPYAWFDHAYGSLVWTLSGYQLLHGLVLLLLGVGVLGLGRRYEQAAALPSAALPSAAQPSESAWSVVRLYWSFVVLASIPMYATLYLVPYLR